MAEIDELTERVRKLEETLALFLATDSDDGRYFPYFPEVDEMLTNFTSANLSRDLPFPLHEEFKKYRGKYRRRYYRDFEFQLDAYRSQSRSEYEQLRQEFHSYLVAESLGFETSEIKLNRYIPVNVYLSEDDSELRKRLVESLSTLLQSFGFEFYDVFPPEISSWYQKWFAKSKEVATSPEVQRRLAKMERALELQHLDERQAEIDKKQAEAVKSAMEAFKDCPNVVSMVGSILIVKITNNESCNVYTRSLTQEEMIFLTNNQHLLKNPDSILEHLSQCNRQPPTNPPHDFLPPSTSPTAHIEGPPNDDADDSSEG